MNIEKLNNELYWIHLQAAQECGNIWYSILNSIHESINQALERKYETIKEKLKKLMNNQMERLDNTRNFYARVIDKTGHSKIQGVI
jgi:RNA binding exosome subunit